MKVTSITRLQRHSSALVRLTADANTSIAMLGRSAKARDYARKDVAQVAGRALAMLVELGMWEVDYIMVEYYRDLYLHQQSTQ